MTFHRKQEPNCSIQVPGWQEPCTDVLELPVRFMYLEMDGDQYVRQAQGGTRLDAAGERFHRRYLSRLPKQTIRLISREHPDGLETETHRYDDDLLLRSVFGQAYDADLRLYFAECARFAGLDAGELIALGEREYAAYVQAEADRMMRVARARDQVDETCGSLLAWLADDKVRDAFRGVLTTMTLVSGRVPWVCGVYGTLAVAVRDIERATGRRVPSGAQEPDEVDFIAGRRILTVPGLCAFNWSTIRKWHWADENDDRVTDMMFSISCLEYELLNSSREGRRVLDNLIGGLFGTGTE